jgi:hypothetical protein
MLMYNYRRAARPAVKPIPMPDFATNEEFKTAIDAALTSAGASDSVRAALVEGVDRGETEHRGEPRSTGGALNLRIGNWVLRTQDMPVLELIGMAAAAATALLAPEAIAAGAVVTGLSSFAGLCWKTWRKGAPLSKAEIAVLGFVQVHGPIALPDLETKATGALGLTTADIDNAVLTLQEVETRDGDVVALIRKDAAGQWRVRAD